MVSSYPGLHHHHGTLSGCCHPHFQMRKLRLSGLVRITRIHLRLLRKGSPWAAMFRMLDVLEQTLNVQPSSCWTSQKTKGLGWQLVTVAGEHTKAVKTPRARGTSVVVDFSAVGFKRAKDMSQMCGHSPGGSWPLQFFSVLSQSRLSEPSGRLGGLRMCLSRGSRRRARSSRFGSRSFLYTKFWGVWELYFFHIWIPNLTCPAKTLKS